MKKEDPYRFLLRLPQPLRSKLARAAERSGRSLNREIVVRLERSLDPWAERKARAAKTLAAVVTAVVVLGSGASFGHWIAGDDGRPPRPAPGYALP